MSQTFYLKSNVLVEVKFLINPPVVDCVIEKEILE